MLNGKNGLVQVTLRFDQAEDLDLHVIEPLRDGGNCEIFYGNTNNYWDGGGLPFPLPFPLPPPPASCGAYGWLDLDSNAGCNIDNVDVENYIYQPGVSPTPGVYTVRVDYYQNCSAFQNVPYEVEVRANGVSRYYCGFFGSNQSDHGSWNSGRNITQFTIR